MKHFSAFVAACQRSGVTFADFEGAAFASKSRTETALVQADIKRRQDDLSRLQASRKREHSKGGEVKCKRDFASRIRQRNGGYAIAEC